MVYVDVEERKKRSVPDDYRQTILEFEGDDVEQ
jgi:hypothetical protein